jgi:Metal binding domain of Ada
MPDKTGPKDLETVLARLREEWQELADLLTSQGKSQDRVVEVEKILLRDASGQYRGKISANPDGSADLILSDHAGNAWVRLGVNRDGEAFFELKDHKGESSFKAAGGTPSIGAAPGPAATPADVPNPAEFQPLESTGASPQPITPAEAGGEPPDESGLAPPLPTPGHDEPPDRDTNFALVDRLEKLTRQYRRLKLFGALVLGLFGVLLATQAYVLFRPCPPGPAVEGLVVRDPNGNIRASLGKTGDKVGLDLWDAHGHRRATLGLGAEGVPGLAFYDQEQRVRAELNLGPEGEPKFTVRDQHGKEIPKEPKSPDDSVHQQPPGGTGLGSEAGVLPSPPSGPAEAVSPKRDAEAEVEFVGSKTSNKYHYPTCKWVKAISPWNVIKFKSAKEAQERHYIPCPVCKPPPLSR